MINYNLFKTLLQENKEHGYIEPGDFIDLNLLELFIQGKRKDVYDLFKPGNNKTKSIGYHVESKCIKCFKLTLKTLSKYNLFKMIGALKLYGLNPSININVYRLGKTIKTEYLFNGRDINLCSSESSLIICEECLNKLKEEAEVLYDIEYDLLSKELDALEEEKKIAMEEKKLLDISVKESKMYRTEKYINNFLNSDSSQYFKEIGFLNIEDLIREDLYDGEIRKYIRSLSHSDFLATTYWKIISFEKKKLSGFKCQQCGSNKGLYTRYKHYSIKGKELKNLNNLLCLCQECHKKLNMDILQLKNI